MNSVAPVLSNPSLQTVPGELLFCQGMVFAGMQLCLSRKICLTHRKCTAYKALPTASYDRLYASKALPSMTSPKEAECSFTGFGESPLRTRPSRCTHTTRHLTARP